MSVPLLFIFALPVIVLWITIPAVLFSATGVRSYEFKEFGRDRTTLRHCGAMIAARS